MFLVGLNAACFKERERFCYILFCVYRMRLIPYYILCSNMLQAELKKNSQLFCKGNLLANSAMLASTFVCVFFTPLHVVQHLCNDIMHKPTQWCDLAYECTFQKHPSRPKLSLAPRKNSSDSLISSRRATSSTDHYRLQSRMW